ncbi:MAG TPA: 4Fe-4S binding protein [Candidatus Lokiarchaeia archaeon]|nr:4Fe-4S binding protein [Candidatus Lokiarchaeia archaeon]
MVHHIDTTKCAACTVTACEDACPKNIYKVYARGGRRKCRIVRPLTLCVKCHLCTTACPYHAITIVEKRGPLPSA